ncbi:HEPN domain-containing protein [Paenibacillus dauci]|uniref:HEPN domain-containing protein n=1 Tax=Paenibacillus dauci TaxID=1567106 RepID=UPI0006199B50|nr:HEPN domain-containing protein [Paenibacillus dauci]
MSIPYTVLKDWVPLVNDLVKQKITLIQGKHSLKMPDFEDVNEHMHFLFCPYCKRALLIVVFPKKNEVKTNLQYCVACGESGPNSKVIDSLAKAQKLFDIQLDFDEALKRILLEQCIVMLATSLEVYLRDIYSTLLNMRYVRFRESLIERFYKDAKNDFLNIGKGRRKFKQDLKIDLFELIDTDDIKKINILTSKRNVIVHNNGIADKSFSNSISIDCEIGREIEITKKEVEEYFLTIGTLSSNLNEIYAQEYKQYTFKEVENYFEGKN